MAVLPTPGSPMSTGLFFVRRDSTWRAKTGRKGGREEGKEEQARKKERRIRTRP
jgi:hypothetical protein